MARYIDTQKVTVPSGFFNKDLGVPDLLNWLEAQPTADVVPRRILFDLERKLHSMLPFKAHSILTDDKHMANSYEMGQERVIYDILNYLAELEKNTRKENGDDNV